MPNADARLPIAPVLAVTTATQALTTMSAWALATVAPAAARELGVSPALIGYQVAVIYVGAVLSALVGGSFVRRLGATRTHQVALGLVAGGCAASALGSLPALAGGALVMGLGYGLTNPAASHLLSRAPSAAHMNFIFSLKQCGVPIGGVLAGLAVPALTLALGWRAALALCAASLVAFAIAIEGASRRWDIDRVRGAPLLAAPFSSLVLVWSNPVLRWLALASFLYSGVQLCLTGFLVTYLVTEIGFELVLAGSILALTHTAGAMGRLVWGGVADRLRSGTRAMMALGVIGMTGALATAAIEPHWPTWLAAAAAGLFGFCAMGWNGVFMAVVARQSPQAIGMATGGSLAITYAGVVAGPAAFGALHERFGMSYGAGFALLALATAVGVVFVALSRSRSLQAAAAR